MTARITEWLEDRTGCRQALHDILYRRIPGGARWRYVWGTTLLAAILVQFVTGLFLAMHYSPSTQTAWESVYYIEHEMTGGSLLRGIHHYMSSAVMILITLHLLQVILHGAYRAPRELNYWLGLAMLLVVFGLSQTGYLLPWDQRGYRATQVATNIASVTPVVGDDARAIALGGSEFGHHTLTRFFALHAGLLPAVLLLLAFVHLALLRRHGYATPENTTREEATYWPHQGLRDATASLAVVGAVLVVAWQWPAELGPPADGTVAFDAARPEWYFRFLYQLLNSLQIENSLLIAAQVIPGVVLLILALMPFIGRTTWGRRFNVAFFAALLVAIALLTGTSFYQDYNGTTDKSRYHIAEVGLARAEAHRAQQLASMGIPPEGAKFQLRNDPLVAGRRLFAHHCGSCHHHYDPDLADPSEGDPLLTVVASDPSAANLYGFGSRRWMEGMLDAEQIAGDHYFGLTQMADGEMVNWVREYVAGAAEEVPQEERAAFAAKIKAVAMAISAEAELPYQWGDDQAKEAQIEEGRRLVVEEFACTDCHTFRGEEVGAGPDLTRYASHEWLKAFIANPQTDRFYYTPDNYDAERLMPPFAEDQEHPELNRLTERELELLVRYLRRDWPMPEESPLPADGAPPVAR